MAKKEVFAFLSLWGVSLLLLLVSPSIGQQSGCDPECLNNGTCRFILAQSIFVCNCTGTGFTGSYCEQQEGITTGSGGGGNNQGSGNLAAILVGASVGGVCVVGCCGICFFGTLKHRREMNSSRSRTTGREDTRDYRTQDTGRSEIGSTREIPPTVDFPVVKEETKVDEPTKEDLKLHAEKKEEGNEPQASLQTNVEEESLKTESVDNISSNVSQENKTSESIREENEKESAVVIEVKEEENSVAQEAATIHESGQESKKQDEIALQIEEDDEESKDVIDVSSRRESELMDENEDSLIKNSFTTTVIKEAWDKIEGVVDVDSFISSVSSDIPSELKNERINSGNYDSSNENGKFLNDSITDAESMLPKFDEEVDMPNPPKQNTQSDSNTTSSNTQKFHIDETDVNEDQYSQDEDQHSGLEEETKDLPSPQSTLRRTTSTSTEPSQESPLQPSQPKHLLLGPRTRPATLTRADVQKLRQKWEKITKE